MQENNGKTRNIVDMITEKDKKEYIYRVKVFENHNSEEFKRMNKKFIKKLLDMNSEPRLEINEYLEEIHNQFN